MIKKFAKPCMITLLLLCVISIASAVGAFPLSIASAETVSAISNADTLYNNMLDSVTKGEYSIPDWHYGDDVTINMPRLEHGDEDEATYQNNNNITFELKRDGKTVYDSFTRGDGFNNYINKSMPAGNYELICTVNDVTVGENHVHWFDADEHFVEDEVLYQGGDPRTIKFTVHKAQNIWARVPNIVSWSYNAFNTKVNRIYAASKFLDSGEHVWFSITKADGTEIDGLSRFTANADGTIDESLIIATLNGLKSGDYKLHVTVEGTENYLELTDSIDFRIEKTSNSWLVPPNVMQWRYNDYNREVNLILGAAKIQDDSNPAVFKVTSDKRGENEITSNFSLVDGLVPEEVASILGKLEVGSYYLWASVAETDSYTSLQSDEPLQFVVSKAANGWVEDLEVINWSYGSYNRKTNRILGTVMHGEINYTILKDGYAVDGLEAFTEVNDTVADILAGLDNGEYSIFARVSVDGNYEKLEPKNKKFTVTKASNSWLERPDVINWSYGSYDKNVNRILGKVSQGTVTFAVSKDGVAVNGLEAFTEVTDTVADKLAGLDCGDYTIAARVSADSNYESLSEQKINFTVAKAANEWLVSPHIIAWQYGEFNADLNLVLAKVTGGKILVKFTNNDGAVLTDEFELEESGIVPVYVADVLKEFGTGDYKLVVRVQADSNYEQIADLQPIPFSVSPLNNDWLVSPNVIQWQFGRYDATTNLILGAAKQGEIAFTVSDINGEALTDSFSLVDGKVPEEVATILENLPKGDYILTAAVAGNGSYSALSTTTQFSVTKAVNSWDKTLSITAWTVGKFNAEENIIDVKAKFGEVIIRIVDSTNKEEPYYEGLLGTDNLNEVLAGLKVGTYQITAKVVGNDDYFDIISESILFEVFEKPGLPWWAILLIIVGLLGAVALALWILHEKGVLQMFTDKILISMRARLTVDATIAAVRASKRAEESRQSIARAEALDKQEAARKAREEFRNMTPEQRVAALEERAALQAARAEKMRKQAERLKEQAERLKNMPANSSVADEADESEDMESVVNTDSTDEE